MTSYNCEHEARRAARSIVQETLGKLAKAHGITKDQIWYERTIVDHPQHPELPKLPSEVVLLVSVGIVNMVEQALQKCELPQEVSVTIHPYDDKKPPLSILRGDAFSLKENWHFSPTDIAE